MGYVAYAAGSLIVAVAIHSLYKKQFGAVIDNESKSGTLVPPSKHAAATNLPKDTSKQDGPEVIIAPPVSIEISKHDIQSSESSEREESPPSGNRKGNGVVRGNETIRHKLEDNDGKDLPKSDTQARQAAIMPPPLMVPSARNRSPPRLQPATTSSLAPPLRGLPTQRGGFAKPTGFVSRTSGSSSLAASSARSGSSRPIQSSSLGVPQQKILANTHMQPSLAPSTSTQAPSKRSSKKVLLSPGHSPLDWAALTKSTAPTAPVTLRGQDASSVLGPYRLGRVTPSQLKHQTGRKGKDAWTSYQGRVYNISAYLDFHPGGVDELMKGAGRSSDALFAEVHPWVNWEGMLGGCLVGMLVSEDDPAAMGREETKEETPNELDEMD